MTKQHPADSEDTAPAEGVRARLVNTAWMSLCKLRIRLVRNNLHAYHGLVAASP